MVGGGTLLATCLTFFVAIRLNKLRAQSFDLKNFESNHISLHSHPTSATIGNSYRNAYGFWDTISRLSWLLNEEILRKSGTNTIRKVWYDIKRLLFLCNYQKATSLSEDAIPFSISVNSLLLFIMLSFFHNCDRDLFCCTGWEPTNPTILYCIPFGSNAIAFPAPQKCRGISKKEFFQKTQIHRKDEYLHRSRASVSHQQLQWRQPSGRGISWSCLHS